MKKKIGVQIGTCLLAVTLLAGCSVLADIQDQQIHSNAALQYNDYKEAYKKSKELESETKYYTMYLERSADIIANNAFNFLNQNEDNFTPEFEKELAEKIQILEEATNKTTSENSKLYYSEAKRNLNNALAGRKIRRAETERAQQAELEKKIAEKAAKEKAAAALADAMKNPDFKFPNKKICTSSVQLYKDFYSGMNKAFIEQKITAPDPKSCAVFLFPEQEINICSEK